MERLHNIEFKFLQKIEFCFLTVSTPHQEKPQPRSWQGRLKEACKGKIGQERLRFNPMVLLPVGSKATEFNLNLSRPIFPFKPLYGLPCLVSGLGLFTGARQMAKEVRLGWSGRNINRKKSIL